MGTMKFIYDFQEEHRKSLRDVDSNAALSAADRTRAKNALGDAPAPFLSVVLGNAGCGKSFLINCLADAVTILYTDKSTRATQPAVVLAAPTGLAAIQIKGSTLHSLLGIEVQHGKDSAMRPLRPAKLNAIRVQV